MSEYKSNYKKIEKEIKEIEEFIPDINPDKEPIRQEVKQEKKLKKSYRIVLVAPLYIVINNNGNNQFINGSFEGKKIGDEIEIEINQ